MAGFNGFRVISFDYQMPPDFPYPKHTRPEK
jgi:acetyl esterase/lipase